MPLTDALVERLVLAAGLSPRGFMHGRSRGLAGHFYQVPPPNITLCDRDKSNVHTCSSDAVITLLNIYNSPHMNPAVTVSDNCTS